MCPSTCIYCDIWQLAVAVFSRTPLASVPSSSRTSSRSPSPSQAGRHYTPRSSLSTAPLARSSTSPPPEVSAWERCALVLEQQFQTQRVRLASIMSICTVEGAAESDGLRLAHDRCLSYVQDLLEEETYLLQTMPAEPAEPESYFLPDDRAWSSSPVSVPSAPTSPTLPCLGHSQCWFDDAHATHRRGRVSVAI